MGLAQGRGTLSANGSGDDGAAGPRRHAFSAPPAWLICRAMPAALPPTDPAVDHDVAAHETRDPVAVRAYESRVWDLAKNLIHPAAIYAVCQILIWMALEENPAFQSPDFNFWSRTVVHAAQFAGAAAVFLGTLLRDMRQPIRLPTFLLWWAVAGAIGAWAWPHRTSADAGGQLWIWLSLQIIPALIGLRITKRTFDRAARRHEIAEASQLVHDTIREAAGLPSRGAADGGADAARAAGPGPRGQA